MNDPTPAPGGTAAPVRRLLGPLEKFLHIEAASGVVLLIAATAAMLWANSPWSASYEAFWHTPLTVGVGGAVVALPLHFWVNDGLMTIFFLVVGLEIRREMHEGALASLRVAALPVAAALGGVLAPAMLYLAIADAPQLQEGWAVPMATDIAFAVGVLALLGRRVPATLRVLLLAIAIIDDIVAILVIALVYSSGIAPEGLAIAGAGIALVILMQRMGFQTAWSYVLPGALVWFGVLRAGVHPTVAGVLLGLLTPVKHAREVENPLAVAARALESVGARLRGQTRGDPKALLEPLRELRHAQLELLPPAPRVEGALHPWVAYGVMPIFALANAGVALGELSLRGDHALPLFAGVTLGLVLGKPLGILIASVLAVRARLCELPAGVDWRGMALIGSLAGIGFTMAIFIANLAFGDERLLAVAKLAVIVASTIAALGGLALGRLVLSAAPEDPEAAREVGDNVHARGCGTAP